MSLNLNYREAGTGNPLIILHGLLGSGNNWGSIAKQLAETHRVFTVDLRNHGRSPHAETMSYEEMSEDVITLMNKLGIQKTILLGHSMGGKTAMAIALNHADRLSQLLVIDIAPVIYPNKYTPLIKILQSVNFDKTHSREDVDQVLQGRIPDSSLRLFLLQNLQRTKEGFKWKCNLEAIQRAMTEISGFPVDTDVKAFTDPTLFVGGSNSDYILRQHYSTIYKLFSNNHIVMLKEAGHWVHADQPQKLIKTILNFIHKKNVQFH